jgi:hypothetical protein
MNTKAIGWALLIVACSPPLGAQGQPGLEISDIELGEQTIGPNTFRATITNPGDTALVAVLDLRAMPGMWLRSNWQGQFGYRLAAGETRSVEESYNFRRMSPEAQLRVRLGPGHQSAEGNFVQDSVSFERRYQVGEDNPAALDIDRYFEHVRRGALDIYALKGSLAAGRMDEIAQERLAAIDSIRVLLDVDAPEQVLLVFYPDSATKTSQTGHIGAGFATGTMIVEIYNDEIQLDPYHELAHVVAYQVGYVPAMFDEGFAVYVSERLGADALEYVGSPGLSVDEAVCGFLRDGTAFSFAELSALEEIGTPESRASVSYPQSASVVKFLIDSYGVERFRATYITLAEEEGAAADRTATAFERVLEMSLSEVGEQWQADAEAICQPGAP